MNVESEAQSCGRVFVIGWTKMLRGVGMEAYVGDGGAAFVFFGGVGEGHVFFDYRYVVLEEC